MSDERLVKIEAGLEFVMGEMLKTNSVEVTLSDESGTKTRNGKRSLK